VASNNEDRLKALTKRFQPEPKKASTAKPKKDVDRSRHSLYLDKTILTRADRAWRDIEHDLYPTEVSKSDFLEACLEYALSHLEEIKVTLTPHDV
jgi:hypothetical protein